MKRILIPAILVATIAVGGVLAYAIWKSPVSAQDYFKDGKDYYEKQKYSEASLQLSNAVQKDPKNRDARYLLALSYLNQKNLYAAVQQLNFLLEYFPEDVEASLKLGDIYLSAGRANRENFELAQQLAKKLLAKDPQNVAALILSGNASAGLQDYRTSVELFEKAVALDPQNAAAFVNLGTAQAIQRKFPDAEQAFLKARQIDPRNKNALISLGNYYRAVGDMGKADASFKEILSMYPDDKDIYVQVAAFYNDTGRFEEAERVLKDSQAKSPKDPTASLLLAGLYDVRGRPAEARKLLVDLKTTFPTNPDVAAKVAMNFMADDPVRAKAEIDQILKADPRSPEGLMMLAQLQFSLGQYDAVEATFGSASALNNAYPQPEFLLGEVAMKKGQMDQALVHFQKSLAVNSGYLPSRVGLAEAMLNQGRLADSRTEVKKVLAVQPGFFSAILMDATLDMAEKKYADAESKLTILLKAQPDNPVVHRQMGLYYNARGRTADAEKSLLRELELSKDQRQALGDITQFYLATKQTDRAIQTINAVPDDQKKGYHYELLGIVYSSAGKIQDSENAYKKAIEKDPSSANAVAQLASLYIQNGRLDEGAKELDVLIAKNASNAGAYTVKGMIAEKQGKTEEAKQIYTQALKIDAYNETAGNNLAFLLAEQGQDLNTALAWAQMARKKRPESPGIADTLGWVYFKLGNYALAREQLQFAVGKQPDYAAFQYHLAMAYKGTRQIAEAQNAFRKAANSPTESKEKSLAQAALKEMSGVK